MPHRLLLDLGVAAGDVAIATLRFCNWKSTGEPLCLKADCEIVMHCSDDRAPGRVREHRVEDLVGQHAPDIGVAIVAPLGLMSRQDRPSIGNACAMMAQALCRSNIVGAAPRCFGQKILASFRSGLYLEGLQGLAF